MNVLAKCLGTCALALTVAVGCSGEKPAPTASPPSEAPKSREEVLYEGVRSAAFQLDSAVQLIDACVIQAKVLADRQEDPETRGAVEELGSTLEAGLRAIAAHTESPPSLSEFSQQFSEEDEKRLKALEASEECLKLLKEAEPALEEMLASEPPEEEEKALKNIQSLLKDAIQAVSDSRDALKG